MTEAPAVRASERAVIFGATRSGKTHLARHLFAAIPPPRVVIDPKDDVDATGSNFSVSFRDPSKLPDAPSVRWVPSDPMDLDAYDRLYQSVWSSGRRWWVWLDEARHAAPARGKMPRHMARHVTQGGGKGLGHLALNQRPVEIDPDLVAQAEHVVTFRLGYPPDVETVAGQIQMHPLDLRRRLGSLPPHGFVWYSRPQNRLFVVGGVN